MKEREGGSKARGYLSVYNPTYKNKKERNSILAAS